MITFYFIKKSKKITNAACAIFGNQIVKEAYIVTHYYFLNGVSNEIIKERLSENEKNITIEFNNIINYDGKNIWIKFTNNRIIEFSASEWGHIKEADYKNSKIIMD